MELYTSDAYYELNPHWHEEEAPWKATQIAALLDSHDIRPRTIVDVGCGTGAVLHHLLEHLPDATGVGYDIAPKAISLAQEHASDRLHFLCEDFFAVEPRHYDLLLLLDVFEHVDDYLGFLRSLRGRAERYIFHIPLDLSVQGMLHDVELRRRRQYGHLHYFTKGTALCTLAYARYQVLKWCYAHRAEDLAGVQNYGFAIRALNLLRRIFFPLAPNLTVKVLGGYSLLVLAC